MKKYLYEIDACDKCGGEFHVQMIPFMPKVLAEKTARAMNRGEQKEYGKSFCKYKVSKTTLVIKEGTPRGYSDWFEFSSRTSKED